MPKQQHKLRTPFLSGDRPNKKSTNLFIMQVFKGKTKLGQRTFSYGNPENPNADELNNAKKEISESNGCNWLSTGGKFLDVWKDENNKLFYYEWDDKVGNVKTMLKKSFGHWLTIKVKLV